jgi:TPR repeat protein
MAVALSAPAMHSASAQNGARQSYTDAMDWYRKSARAGDPKAQFYYGLALEAGEQGPRDLAAARLWFKQAAATQFPLALYKLALMTQFGQGGPADPVKARRLYKLAADRGVVEAKFNLALMLLDGVGGVADGKAAAEFFVAAARDGVTVSFLHLAILYSRGEEVESDPVEALKWAYLAVQAKVPSASGVAESLASRLLGEQIANAEARARAWK